MSYLVKTERQNLMSETIKVSIIIPCYNSEKYIENCIHSIRSQSEKNIEIITINDGSLDTTEMILKSLQEKDNRIQIISKQNGGVSSARNIGLKKARGQFIMFVDADDWIDSNMVEVLYTKANQYNADVVRCNRVNEYPEKQKNVVKKPLFEKETVIEKSNYKENIYKEFLSRGRLSAIWMTLFRREIIELKKLSFDENMAVDEDAVFSMKFFSHSNRFVYVPLPLYHYIKHGEGLSGTGVKIKKRWESRLKHISLLREQLSEWNMSTSENVEKINEKLIFVSVYTAMSIFQKNRTGAFKDKRALFIDIMENENVRNAMKFGRGKNLLLPEKITYALAKRRLYNSACYLSYLFNRIVGMLRPFIESLVR